MTESDKVICQKRIYFYKPPSIIAKEMGMEVSLVKEVLEKNKGYLVELTNERTDIWKGKYKKLIKLSHCALQDILKADHRVREYKDGEVVKETINGELLKMKKEVAERVLEEAEIIKTRKVGGGINIDNRRQTVIQDKERVLEIEDALQDCRIEIPDLTGDN